jgi:Predicted membrane protein
MILQFCALTLMEVHVAVPFKDMNGYFRFSFPAQFLLLLFVVLLRRSLSRAFRREGGDTMPDDCWKWGSFYFNRSDPALVVPLRSGIGYSYNYAHRTTRILMTLTACALVLLFVHIP